MALSKRSKEGSVVVVVVVGSAGFKAARSTDKRLVCEKEHTRAPARAEAERVAEWDSERGARRSAAIKSQRAGSFGAAPGMGYG